MCSKSVIDNTIAGPDTVDKKIYRTKFFYNSTVSPHAIDALLAKKPPVHHNNISHIARSRTVLPSVRSGDSKVLQTRGTSILSNKECVILKDKTWKHVRVKAILYVQWTEGAR